MINLLPPEYAMRIRFGRSNTVLRRWILGSLLAIAGLAVIFAGGWLYLKQQSSDLQRSLNVTNAELQAQNISKVQKEATEISGDIKAINSILGNEIKFSNLIQDIGRIMPSGSVLASLSLSKIDGAVDLTVNAKDYNSAAQVAVNLNDKTNGLFSKVDIVNISCGNNTNTQYGCSAVYKALFGPTAQKKYLNVPQQVKS